jgi:hypothetical protein
LFNGGTRKKKPCPFLFSVAKPKLDSQKPYPSYLHHVQGLAQVKVAGTSTPLFLLQSKSWTLKNHIHTTCVSGKTCTSKTHCSPLHPQSHSFVAKPEMDSQKPYASYLHFTAKKTQKKK